MLFYVGLHQPGDAKRFDRAFISVNRIRTRKAPIGAKAWIMDSASFTELSTHGRYRHDVGEYAEVVNRWASDPALVAVVAQDYMCEPWIIRMVKKISVDPSECAHRWNYVRQVPDRGRIQNVDHPLRCRICGLLGLRPRDPRDVEFVNSNLRHTVITVSSPCAHDTRQG